MLYAQLRRLLRLRILRLILLVVAVWTLLEAYNIQRNLIAADSKPVDRVNEEKIFLTFLPWNNEYVLRTHVINQIRDLVHALGVGNVFLSIYENGSYDGTKDALRDLHRELEALGVRSYFILDETTHEDLVKERPTEPKEGWVRVDKTGYEAFGINKGDYALRRIHYLASLRKKVLEPLEELAAKGEKFDKILFLNDVTFTADDILKLLHTRDGHYATACTLDFQLPPQFYDTFALRDADGDPAIMLTWPYFASSASRKALQTGDPVPVQSCWNGIVAMNASPFYTQSHEDGHALRFRGVPDSLALSHVEGSECCLVHYDNPLSSTLGNWINPAVRVGYCHPGLMKAKFDYDWDVFKRVCSWAYEGVHPGEGRSWVGYWDIVWGLWGNRMRRMVFVSGLQNWKVKRRVREWVASGGSGGEVRREPGEACLVDEMQLIEPHGWLHA